MILQENQAINLLLNGLLHFANVPNGRCGVEVSAETDDYNQSVFCIWSPTMKQMDRNQENFSFLEQRFDSFDGSAFRNHTVLEEGIQSLLQQNDVNRAEMAIEHLREDIPVPFGKSEREKLLKNERD